MEKIKVKRIWELDFLRGIAIFLMVLFHIVYNLNVFFNSYTFDHYEGFWFYEGRLAAFLFIGLTGVASAIIGQRYDRKNAIRKNIYRGLRLIGLGMIITIVTWLFDPSQTIWFGILHFLGVSIILSTFFMYFKWLNIPFAIIAMVLGIWFDTLRSTHFFWLPFGIRPHSFQTFDYYAFFPWFAITLIGITFGNFIYQKNKTIIKRVSTKSEKTISFIGKYSLWIYMAHQPILLGLLWVFFK